VSHRVSFVATHTAMPPLIFAPIVRVHPAALTVRVHEVPRPVRVRLQGGWVRNGINSLTPKSVPVGDKKIVKSETLYSTEGIKYGNSIRTSGKSALRHGNRTRK
jgi:hypothetical protein